MLRFLGLLFIWMKYYHISKNNVLYKSISRHIKYAWFFYFLRFLYPFWLVFGLFTGNVIYVILLSISLSKFAIYPLLKGKKYRIYELSESILSIILYILLMLKV